jgi:hypothetical protein
MRLTDTIGTAATLNIRLCMVFSVNRRRTRRLRGELSWAALRFGFQYGHDNLDEATCGRDCLLGLLDRHP